MSATQRYLIEWPSWTPSMICNGRAQYTVTFVCMLELFELHHTTGPDPATHLKPRSVSRVQQVQSAVGSVIATRDR